MRCMRCERWRSKKFPLCISENAQNKRSLFSVRNSPIKKQFVMIIMSKVLSKSFS